MSIARAFRRSLTLAPIAVARLVAIAVALVALAAPASALASGSIGAIGVNDIRSDGILLPNANWNGLADLNMVAGAGVQLYRARIQLNCVDPNHTGRFNFTAPSPSCYGLSYDALVGALAQRNMTLLPILINFSGSTPQPPTPDGAGGSPTISEFAAFAAAAVTRYGPTGTYWATCGCTPHPISAWEIWNEENNGYWWGGTASASQYAAVFSATRGALRSVDPQARAVVGGLAFDPAGQPSFIPPDQMIATLAAGNANAFDAVAVHPYTVAAGSSSTELAEDTISLINSVAAQLVASTGPGPGGAPRQQIWVTEMGWSNQQEDPNTIAAGLQTFFSLLSSGVRAEDNVGPVLWYDLRDNATLSVRDDQLGLRYTNADGSDAGPKPAWGVFAAAAAQGGTLPLPAALADSGPYIGPAPTGSTSSGSAQASSGTGLGASGARGRVRRLGRPRARLEGQGHGQSGGLPRGHPPRAPRARVRQGEGEGEVHRQRASDASAGSSRPRTAGSLRERLPRRSTGPGRMSAAAAPILSRVPCAPQSRPMKAWPTRSLALVAALILACATAGTARAAAPPGFVGMVSEDTFAGSARYQNTELAAMQKAGVTLLRQVFDWSIIERRRNVYNFSVYDATVAAAAKRGIEIMPILFNEPSYLSSRPRRHAQRGTYPPSNLNSIAAFVRAAVRWYGPNGTFWTKHPTVPKLPIRIWQVWNEPNLNVYWLPRPSASHYVTLLSVASKAIHELDPQAEVVSGGIPESPLGIEMFTYLRSMLHAGAADWMNTVGINAYSPTASGLIALLRRVRSTLDGARRVAVAIRVTEFGWSDTGPGSLYRLGARGQATQISAVVKDFYAVRSALDLQGFVYFDWRDARPYKGGFNFWGLHTGLLKLNGKPKPALKAFSSAANGL